MEEKEIKIQVSKKIFDRVKKLIVGKKLKEKVKKQTDIYFDNELMSITNLNRGLRIRFNGNVVSQLEFKSLFFNKHTRKDNPWYIEEISLDMPLNKKSYKKLDSILQRLAVSLPRLEMETLDYKGLKIALANVGLYPKITVTKDRQEFVGKNAIYVFDYIKELGYFIEIETNDGTDPLKIINKVIGNKDYSFIRNGYNDMVAKNIDNYLSNEVKQLLFKINHQWNILPTEEKLVDKLLSSYK